MLTSRGRFADDIVGQRFNSLLVLSRVENSIYSNVSKDGKVVVCPRARWLCRCDCGREVEINGKELRRGQKTCGCIYRREWGESSFNTLYSRSMKNARYRNHEWALTKEQVREITSKNCFYCGKEPSQIMTSYHSRGDYIYNGIDRVNTRKGYVIGNVVTCCKVCNFAKRTLSIEDFREMIISTYNHWASKS